MMSARTMNAASSAGAEEFDVDFAFAGDVEMVVNNPMGGYAAGGATKPSSPSRGNLGLEAAEEEEVEVVVAMGASRRPEGGGVGSTSTDASGLDGLFAGSEESKESGRAAEEPPDAGSDSLTIDVVEEGSRQSKRVSELLQQPRRSIGRRSSVSAHPAMGQQVAITTPGLKRAGTFRL